MLTGFVRGRSGPREYQFSRNRMVFIRSIIRRLLFSTIIERQSHQLSLVKFPLTTNPKDERLRLMIILRTLGTQFSRLRIVPTTSNRRVRKHNQKQNSVYYCVYTLTVLYYQGILYLILKQFGIESVFICKL